MSARPVLGMGARLAKLRAMSPREVASRIAYAAAIAAERRAWRRGTLAPSGRLSRAVRRDLCGPGWEARLLAARAATPARFLPGAHDREGMRALFAQRFRPGRDATLAQAALARAHQFAFFGQAFHYDGSIDWQADPVTGRRWPSTYHADVPVHRGDIGCGDVKHVWELSRQQYLIDLAKAHFLADDAASLAALRALVRSWIAGNPYATGVNWACALEPAFRALSWLWAYHLTAPALDDAFHLEWLEAMYDHARFLARHLEHYSSPYNHLIGEAAALYMIGSCFPEFRDAAGWRSKARGVLEGRLAGQFYADGGSVEQSPFYHHATVGFYLLAGLTARANGEDLSPDVWRAIERGLGYSQALMQPDGRTPEIGGADDGKPIRMEHLPLWDFRPYLAIGAVAFGRPAFKAGAGRFFEDALWLTGPGGLARFDALDEAAPGTASAALPHSGYYVLRGAGDRGDYVCVDCGEQAAGMRPDGIANSMHGHADCLSIVAWLGGRRVLADSGLYAYNCGGPWEAHFRETAAHSTARVDARDQATHLGKMAWSHSYRAAPEQWHRGERDTWFVGSHDGYARGPQGVTHRRAVWLRPGGSLIVCDQFEGRGTHDLEVTYQFAPGTLEARGPLAVTYDRAVDLVWAGGDAWEPDLRCGGPDPQDGWICPSLGVRVPAPRLTLRTRSSGPLTTLLTVLAVRSDDGPRAATVRVQGAAPPLIAITGRDTIDWVFAGDEQGVIDTDARVGVCRVRGADIVETLHIGGTHVRADARALSAAWRAHIDGGTSS